MLVDAPDQNKCFSANFRTLPKDSTGVPHILEHSVLCGSKRFPSKEPFVDLLKGSLKTFLNAMTAADKTMYPVASQSISLAGISTVLPSACSSCRRLLFPCSPSARAQPALGASSLAPLLLSARLSHLSCSLAPLVLSRADKKDFFNLVSVYLDACLNPRILDPEHGPRILKQVPPTPYFLLPTPYSLRPTPYTLHPTSYSLLPASDFLRACAQAGGLALHAQRGRRAH